MKLSSELIIKITDVLGIRFINKDFTTIRLEIDARIEDFNESMLPNQFSKKDEDFIIPKETISSYVNLLELNSILMECFEEQEVTA